MAWSTSTLLLLIWIISLLVTILFVVIPIATTNPNMSEGEAKADATMWVLSGVSLITFIGTFIAWLVHGPGT